MGANDTVCVNKSVSLSESSRPEAPPELHLRSRILNVMKWRARKHSAVKMLLT